MRIPHLLCVLAILSPSEATSQAPQRSDSARRDPTNTLPLATTRTARFTTTEGTWMSVDVSPDGTTLVFDLLGDLYTLPIAGGTATRIVAGNSVDGQPRFSPDGQSLVFTSDRSGVDATWIANTDGSRPRLLVAGGSHPAWTPDGRQVVTGNRLVDVRGGAGVQIQGFGTAASFTADGRYIWYQNGTQAARYDRSTGTTSFQTNLPGGVLRPMVSRDGKSLAYFTRFESRPALVIRDLVSGADRWVLLGTQPEASGSPAVGALPGSAWLPDGTAIITSFGGKLWRVDVASGRATQIPFTADVELAMGPLVRGNFPIGDSVVVREIREPALSPDGRSVAFTALGKVWVSALGGTPRRLTAGSGMVELSPAWTPDGRSIAYATWVDGAGGDIFLVPAGGGAARNLTRAPAMYTRLNFTPDGSRLAFARAPQRARTVAVDDAAVQARTPAGVGTELNLELRWIDPAGGVQHPIAMVADVGVLPLGASPHFTGDTSRVVYHDGTALVSVRWDGTDRRVVLAGAAPQTLLAPDGARVVSRAGRRNQIHLYERPQVTDSITIDPTADRPPVPVRRLTRAGGEFPAWSHDGTKLTWSSGTTLHVYDVAAAERAVADSVAQAPTPPASPDSTRRAATPADSTARNRVAYEATRYDISIVVPADAPTGAIVLRGGTVISMKGSEVIANADVVVSGNRITAVGARGTVAVPRGARIVDVSGKTIVPGYIDLHSQVGAPAQVHRTVVSQYLANLAFGVTTLRDPEAPSHDVFTYADRIATGDLLGPRLFPTGPVAVDSALTMRTPAEARDFVGPYATSYRSTAIRADLAASRADRQRFLAASRESGLSAVATGTPDFRRSLSAILDGFADHQAAYEIFPTHGDWAALMAQSGLTYTPMLLGRVGSRNGYEYLLATELPHADPKVRRFTYHKDLDRLTRTRGTWFWDDEYPFEAIAQGAASIVAAGGRVGIGTNGRVQGLAFHWEMWLLARGGMSNHDILRAATIFGAEAIGVGTDLGSIEVGKLADLQVLDRNPLEEIRHTTSLRYVMKNGRLYDANTLDQIAPVRRPLASPWWQVLEPTEESR